MGVKSILRWAVAKGTQPNYQDEEKIQQAIESLLGKQVVKEKTWVVQLQYLRQAPAATSDRTKGAGLKDTWLIKFSESPDSCFLHIRAEKRVVEVSSNMLQLLEKKLDYRTKISLKFEGKRWRLGDFAVKLGAVTQSGGAGANFLGHMVEVEYVALQHREVAEPLMKEFISHLVSAVPPSPFGWLEPLLAPVPDYGTLPKEFGLLHSCVQYAELAAVLLTGSNR